MMSVIINAILVGIAVWISSQWWNVTGLGLVFTTVVVYIVVRVVVGLILLALSAALGRRRLNVMTWS